MRIHPVILAGGRGERFWPLSRRSRPKQLLPLLSDRPMILDTLERLDGIAAPEDTWVITSRDLLPAVREVLPQVPFDHVVGEPMGKNTAPAVALAAWWLKGAGPEAVCVVLPSDHRVEPAARLRSDLEGAARAALKRRAIVVLGIAPTRPETGFGYIEVAGGEPGPIHAVSAFREKPDLATAARYVSDGRHLWNAGMFVFTPGVMLEEIRAHAPEIAALLPSLPDGPGPGADGALERYYAAAPSISIDYAVMERTRLALVASAGFQWDDLGSWAAVGATGTPDASGNVTRGRTMLLDSKGIVAFSEGGLVAAVGVKDLVIVRTGDVTLVCPRDRAQEVRSLVEQLKREEGSGGYL